MAAEESPGHQSQRADIPERADEQKRATSQAIDEPKPYEGKHEIGEPDADRLKQSRFGSQSGEFEDARCEIENRVDPRELVEEGD
jgi:hypothetical protein